MHCSDCIVRAQALHEIDQVGITPDKSCGLPGKPRTIVLTGVPIGPAAELGAAIALEHDDCVITAENFLGNAVAAVAAK